MRLRIFLSQKNHKFFVLDFADSTKSDNFNPA